MQERLRKRKLELFIRKEAAKKKRQEELEREWNNNFEDDLLLEREITTSEY